MKSATRHVRARSIPRGADVLVKDGLNRFRRLRTTFVGTPKCQAPGAHAEGSVRNVAFEARALVARAGIVHAGTRRTDSSADVGVVGPPIVVGSRRIGDASRRILDSRLDISDVGANISDPWPDDGDDCPSNLDRSLDMFDGSVRIGRRLARHRLCVPTYRRRVRTYP